MNETSTRTSPSPDPRRDMLLEGLHRTAKIVEVGASFRPLAPKRDGWNTCVVDHDTRENLVAKYSDAAIVPEEIEPVDVVWREGLLHEAFPQSMLGTFDAVVVSHVMEHLPDLIAFLDSTRRLVRNDGCLVFALPDKRWCFDFFRHPTLAGDVLLAHHEKRMRHSPAVLFNAIAYSTTLEGRPGWCAGESAAELKLFHPLAVAHEVFDTVAQGDSTYRDAHAWQFTPASFQLLILDLGLVNVCDWQVEWVRPAKAVEFLGRMRPGKAVFANDAEMQKRRLALLFETGRELAAQWRTLPPANCLARFLRSVA